MKKHCGISNIQESNYLFSTFTSSNKCILSLPKTINWSKNDFQNEINRWMYRYNNFYHSIQTISLVHKKLFPEKNLPILLINYESLQLNHDNIVQNLIRKVLPLISANAVLGVTDENSIIQSTAEGIIHTKQEKYHNQSSRSILRTSKVNNIQTGPKVSWFDRYTWIKRSGEDLSQIFVNYNELKEMLSDSSCECLLNQLISKEIKIFPYCPIYITSRGCRAINNATAFVSSDFLLI